MKRERGDAAEAMRHTPKPAPAPLDDLPMFGPSDEPPRERPAHHEPRPQPLSIDEQFHAFHMANPHVYAEIARRAMLLYRSGGRRVGIGALVEEIRCDVQLQTSGRDFKINNNFRSRYARLLLQRQPELKGVIELRGLRSA